MILTHRKCQLSWGQQAERRGIAAAAATGAAARLPAREAAVTAQHLSLCLEHSRAVLLVWTVVSMMFGVYELRPPG